MATRGKANARLTNDWSTSRGRNDRSFGRSSDLRRIHELNFAALLAPEAEQGDFEHGTAARDPSVQGRRPIQASLSLPTRLLQRASLARRAECRESGVGL